MKFSGLRDLFGAVVVCLALIAIPASLSGQELSFGGVFPLFETEEFCESSTFGAVQFGFETPISGSIHGQLEAYYAPSGSYPWPWTPIGGGGGGAQAPSAYDHDGGFRIAANVLFPLTSMDRLSFKGLVGAGVRRLGAADYSPARGEEIEQYGVDSQTSPLITFGVVADIGLNDRLGLRLQGRGNAIFSGELQLRGATAAQDRVLASDTQTFAQAMIGLTVKVGG